MTQKEILNVCCKSGGLLGSKVSNFIGLFDQLKYYGIKASDVVGILNMLPEFAL
jgi:hypothetical protein